MTLILDGREVRSNEFRPVDIGNPIDWSMDPFKHRSWRFQFHSLTWAYPLADMSESDSSGLTLESVLRQWIAANPIHKPPSDYSWSDHSTALRARVLVFATERLDRPEWLVESIRTHGDVLAREDFYRGQGNHALDQNLALHELALFLGHDDWVALAERRINNLALDSVDEQGVINEGSVKYQGYNYRQYGEAIAQLERTGRSVSPEVLRRWKMMPDMLAHATRPDRYYEQLGDTYLDRAYLNKGTVAEFAATQGKSGPRPDRRVAVFDAGYVFGRSGWGDSRPFDQENFYSIRFGNGGSWRFHGHSDHTSLTWHPRGIPTIIEAGFNGHERTPYRYRYIKGPAGHNVVAVREIAHTPTAPTRLVASQIDASRESYHFVSETYEGIRRDRRILVLHNPAALFVLDELVSDQGSFTFDQIWHLHPDFGVYLDFRGAGAVKGDVTVRFNQVLGGTMQVVCGASDPIQGWTSYQAAERLPAPTLVTTKTGMSARFLTVIALCSELSTQLDGEMLCSRVDNVDVCVSIDGPLIREM